MSNSPSTEQWGRCIQLDFIHLELEPLAVMYSVQHQYRVSDR